MLLYDVNVVEALRPVTGCGRVASLQDEGYNRLAAGIPECLPDQGPAGCGSFFQSSACQDRTGQDGTAPVVIPLLCSEGYEQQEDRDREGDHEVVINR